MKRKPSQIVLKTLPAGTYIAAVSGGVDSMVLIELLQQQPQLQLVIAHVDHCIRDDSQQDRKFVQTYAMSHNIIFEYCELRLGKHASEAKARQGRYAFLRRMSKKYNARAIILAHHHDDMLETTMLNIMRGTGRRGVGALVSHADLLRPLLHVPKADIVEYARAHGITWREDPSNQDQKYLRNFVRHSVLAPADLPTKKKLLDIIVRHKKLNNTIDNELRRWCDWHVLTDKTTTSLPRYQLIMLPQPVALEVLQFVIKQQVGNTLVRMLAAKALLFAKTAMMHKRFVLNKTWQLRIAPAQAVKPGRSAQYFANKPAETTVVIVEPRESVLS